MIHALLHRKLDERATNAHRREDTLTAVVFGTLVWFEAWDTLAKWLGVPSPPPGTETGCWFWPRLAGSVEPDVIVRIGNHLVVVEAKLRSSRHDKSASIQADEQEDEPAIADQLFRQYRGITTPPAERRRYPDELERAIEACSLVQIYLVDRRRVRTAEKEVAESRGRLPSGAELREPLTWQALSALLAARLSQKPRWETDLLDYMRMVGLDTFRGVSGRRMSSTMAHVAAWRVARRGRPTVVDLMVRVQTASGVRRLRQWRLAGSFR